MITIEIHKIENQYSGFLSSGHAGYADDGYDIICAAVSVLTVNTINSIETFTGDPFSVRQEDGLVELVLEGTVSEKTSLLLDSLIFGLLDIQEEYGEPYITICYKEV